MSLMKEKTVDVRPSLLSAEENIKSQIVVLDQLRDLIPPLTSDELKQLEQNVLKYGVKDPLTIWETTDITADIGHDDVPVYVLVDGHNRHHIIQKHHLDFRINLARFASLDEVKEYMIDYQLGRRNLNPEQASYLRGMRYNQQKAQRGSNLRVGSPQQNVAETLATEYGVSSRTIKRDGEFAASLEKVDPDTKRDVLAGKLPKSAVQSQLKSIIDTAEIPAVRLGSPAKTKITKQVDVLQSDIRKLVNGDLNLESCTELIQKANDLLTLFSPK